MNRGAVKAQASQMLPIRGHDLPVETDMEPKEQRERLKGILAALAAGRSCEQILAADRTLTYHDIFHAAAEAPTSHWAKPSAGNTEKGSLGRANPARTPLRQRTD